MAKNCSCEICEGLAELLENPNEGDLRIWWIPQVPGNPFLFPVSNLLEAKRVLDILGEYDAFQYEHGIKPDYSNAGGLHVYEGGVWVDWYSDEGEDIDFYSYQQVKEIINKQP